MINCDCIAGKSDTLKFVYKTIAVDLFSVDIQVFYICVHNICQKRSLSFRYCQEMTLTVYGSRKRQNISVPFYNPASVFGRSNRRPVIR